MPNIANNSSQRIDQMVDENVYSLQFRVPRFQLRNESGSTRRYSTRWIATDYGYLFDIRLVNSGGTTISNNNHANLSDFTETYLGRNFLQGFRLSNNSGGQRTWEVQYHDTAGGIIPRLVISA